MASSPITLRVTDEERAQLKKLSAGQPVSAYIRECLFGSQRSKRSRARYQPVADQQAFAKLLAPLGQTRIANNLNQLAHHANCGTLIVNTEVLEQIEEAYRYIQEMRVTLVTAVGLRDKSSLS
ncbi:hypothetical protein AB833_25795 [Chromatiales bacterium (ex Bugula neritina AB1)]|nr:hypothetical protein AB833_25795 [Chromatiales bacterium (ex Bugula neritina AB1)]